jgi:microcompartment protein CcmL/EutN
MSHTITDKSKLTVVQVEGDLATIDASIQTALRGSAFANGDKIIDISIVKNRHSNRLVAYITFEDQ